MSDTPETDKNTWSDSSDGVLYNVVTADFARRMERERDEALLKIERLKIELAKAFNRLQEVGK